MLDRCRSLREIITAAGHAIGNLVSRSEFEKPKKNAPSRQQGKAPDGEHRRRRVRFRYTLPAPHRLSDFRI